MNGFLKNIPWRWILFGVLAYAVFLIATFPAERVTARLQTYNVQIAGASGSVWHGRAVAMQVRGFTLGPTEWRVNFWRIPLGKLSIELRSKRDDGFVNAHIDLGLGGAITLRDLHASLPIAALSGMNFPAGWPNGWQGQLQLNFDTLKLVNRWPSEVSGRLSITGLTRETPPPLLPLGDQNLSFAKNAGASKDLIGTISSSSDAPLDISGSVQLTANHTTLISVLIKLRSNAPASLRQEFERSILPREQDGWRMQFEFAAASF